jgi:nitroreductase
VATHFGPRELVESEPLATRSQEGAARSVRDLQHAPSLPAAPLQRSQRLAEVVDAIHENWLLALDVVGQQDAGRRLGQLDHRDPRSGVVDGKHEPAAKHPAEEGGVGRHVATGHVHEIQLPEGSSSLPTCIGQRPAHLCYGTAMSDATQSEGDSSASTRERVRPLLRVRQIREFTSEVVARDKLDAIVDAARWSGSSRNSQPWRFIVIREADTLRRIHEAGMPQTRSFQTATAGIAIVLPAEPARALSDAYDDGRVAERILIAASMLDLGAAIAWIRSDVRSVISDLLGLPEERFVRTIVAIGHPSEAGLRPKSAPGTARLPRQEVVFEERWPA